MADVEYKPKLRREMLRRAAWFASEEAQEKIEQIDERMQDNQEPKTPEMQKAVSDLIFLHSILRDFLQFEFGCRPHPRRHWPLFTYLEDKVKEKGFTTSDYHKSEFKQYEKAKRHGQ